MLRILIKFAGRRAVRFVALLYLAGVILPSVALAFADGAVTGDCFDEIAQIATSQVDDHSDGTARRHDDEKSFGAMQSQNEKSQDRTGTRGHSHDQNCCGLFGFTAVLPALSGTIDEPAAYHIQQPILTNCLVGCGPERINRPPIRSLPM